MSINAERKQALITDYATKPGDTGSPEVQVAILSERIRNLTGHLGAPGPGDPMELGFPGCPLIRPRWRPGDKIPTSTGAGTGWPVGCCRGPI